MSMEKKKEEKWCVLADDFQVSTVYVSLFPLLKIVWCENERPLEALSINLFIYPSSFPITLSASRFVAILYLSTRIFFDLFFTSLCVLRLTERISTSNVV